MYKQIKKIEYALDQRGRLLIEGPDGAVLNFDVGVSDIDLAASELTVKILRVIK